MKLKNLLDKINCTEIYGDVDVEIKNISINSKKAEKGSLFVAIEGFKCDGHDFIEEAVSAGASAVVTQKRVNIPSNITQVVVNNTRKALPLLCRNFYRNPTASFKLIGVTGTNGKTTTSYLIDSILRTAGIKTSMITTVESFLGGREVSFERTTPESLDLNIFFDKSRQEKVGAACMEVSSHSIDLHRVDYLDFNYFVFTNLSQDHLDYHKDMENYFDVKKKLFLKNNRNIYGGEKAVVNIDDSYGREILKVTDLEKISYSIESDNADIWPSNINNSISGIRMTVNTGDGKKIDISSPLCGYFNVYNILAATGVCFDMGIKTDYIIEGINSMHGVKGRFEKVYTDGKITVVIDYAHTPDGLKNVLCTGRELLKQGGRLISVFGCGGDRDMSKRKIMGYISGRYADYTIITSDNPRSEEPLSIINMIKEGIVNSGNDRFNVEVDRKKAIFKA
ncbi:MAG: UDP-N-acetylmuramoyl-L-alanyl-D-glutamate--2,6-diaminopimelate ligase, partial [Actinomycetota bacterium]|nr:UDP-N-acetylmuramoyl-L-alanyl-D-glutamate--2,6-diaminopimelate ligase [Actinomycetota bacterium]